MAGAPGTDCTCTLLAHRITEKHKLRYSPARRVRLIAANDQHMHVEGEVKVRITLNSISSKIRVVITKDMKENMLISKIYLKPSQVIP